MPPFNPPNPYGSYFGFNEPGAAASGAFLPGMSPGLTPGVSAALGAAQGGFNPTLGEFRQNRYRDIAYQQFLAQAMSQDPRVGTVSNMVLSAMYGAAGTSARNAAVSRFGGMGNINEIMGFAMGMPGISSFFGGAPSAIPLGALGAATSGMRYTSPMGGAPRAMWGDNPLAIGGAMAINASVRSRFYSPSGAANLSMTQGLNMDQIGGLLMTGGQQGAFAGLDMGKLDMDMDQIGGLLMTGGQQGAFAGLDMGKLDMANGRAKQMVGGGTLDKITEFTKNAAKAIGSLIDVYGNDNIANLLNKARQITGLDLSRLENAGIMNSRLQGLRNTARTTGTDVQSMFDMAAGGTNMAMALGMGVAGAGAVSNYAANNAAYRYREHELLSSSMYMAGTSQGEMQAGGIRDAVGMLRDPLGARRNAVSLMIQEGRIPAEAGADLQTRMRGMGPQNISSLDAEIRNKYKVSLPGYIAAQGGADRMFENLNEANKSQAVADQQGDINNRTGLYIRKFFRQNTTSSKGMGRMEELIRTFDPEKLQSILKASDIGASMTKLKELVSEDMAGAERPDYFAGQIATLRGEQGKNLAGLHQSILHDLSNPALPFTSQFASRATLMDRADQFFRNAPLVPDTPRGQSMRTFMQGMFERADNRDAGSAFAMTMQMSPGNGDQGPNRIAGSGRYLNYDAASYRNPMTGKLDFKAVAGMAQNTYLEFSKTEEGRRALFGMGIGTGQGIGLPKTGAFNEQTLTNFYNEMTNPMSREMILRGFTPFNGPNGSSMYLPNAEIERTRSGAMFQGLMLSTVGEDLRKNSKIPTIQTRAMRELGMEMTTGREWHVDPTTGEWKIQNGKKLSAANMEKIQKASIELVSHADQLRFWSLDAIEKLGKDKQMGQIAMDALNAYDKNLVNDKTLWQSEKTVRSADARARMKVLAEKDQIVATPDQGSIAVSKITGFLKLSPERDGFIVDATTTEQPKK